MPEIDAIVTCKVVRVNPRFAAVSIMVVGETPCKDDFQGIIRVQDVRATEKDKVKIYNSFRPGDIVRAQVVSLLYGSLSLSSSIISLLFAVQNGSIKLTLHRGLIDFIGRCQELLSVNGVKRIGRDLWNKRCRRILGSHFVAGDAVHKDESNRAQKVCQAYVNRIFCLIPFKHQRRHFSFAIAFLSIKTASCNTANPPPPVGSQYHAMAGR